MPEELQPKKYIDHEKHMEWDIHPVHTTHDTTPETDTIITPTNSGPERIISGIAMNASDILDLRLEKHLMSPDPATKSMVEALLKQTIMKGLKQHAVDINATFDEETVNFFWERDMSYRATVVMRPLNTRASRWDGNRKAKVDNLVTALKPIETKPTKPTWQK